MDKVNSNNSSSKYLIVREIQILHDKNLPLNITAVKRHSPDVMTAVYSFRPYWGWRAALEDAGLSYESVRIQILTKCTCPVCGRSLGKLSRHLLTTHKIRREEYFLEYPGEELSAEVFRRFRHRTKPPIPHWEPMWSPEYVLDRIAAYARQQVPLNYQNMVETERPLTWAALASFGSWDSALTRVGLVPADVRLKELEQSLSRKEVLDELRKRWKAGESLHSSFLERGSPADEQTGNLRLINAARRRFGSYRKALVAAGIPADEVIGKRYTRQYIAQVAAETARVATLPRYERVAAVKELMKNYTAMVNIRFGSWQKLAVILGIEPWRININPFPVREAVMEALDEYIRAGHPLTWKDVMLRDKALHYAITRRFGSFTKLLAHLEANPLEQASLFPLQNSGA